MRNKIGSTWDIAARYKQIKIKFGKEVVKLTSKSDNEMESTILMTMLRASSRAESP